MICSALTFALVLLAFSVTFLAGLFIGVMIPFFVAKQVDVGWTTTERGYFLLKRSKDQH